MDRFRSVCSVIAVLLFAVAPEAIHAQGNSATPFAFLVACSGYDANELRKLAHTSAEMGEFRDALVKTGFEPKNIKFLHDKTDDPVRFLPTRKNILDELDLLLGRVHEDDRVVVALNGHGVEFKGDTTGYFCPVDARLIEKTSLISMEVVYAKLKLSRAKMKLLIVNACRNDPASDHSQAGSKVELRDEYADLAKIPQGIAAILSCSAGERSYYYNPDDARTKGRKRSLFFHHLIDAWQGKHTFQGTAVTLEEVFAQVKSKTQADADWLYRRPQTPWIKREYTSDWVVAMSGQKCKAAHARLAISLEPLKEVDAKKWTAAKSGLTQIELVIPGGGGDAMGLRRGDVITAINGVQVASVKQSLAAMKQLKLGSPIELAILRDGERHVLNGRCESPFSPNEDLQSLLPVATSDPVVQYMVGHIYEDGRGTAKDNGEAFKWYTRAAEQGHALAQVRLGLLNRNGLGTTKNDAAAVKWFRKAAAQHDPGGQVYLGWMYEMGRGVEKNDEEAVQWYRKAAEQGSAVGQNNLGAMYSRGRGLPKDEVKAVEWFRKSAEQECTFGQQNLGDMYCDGRGVAKDEKLAVEWYRRAAEQGYANAQHRLGRMYRDGRGVAKDDIEAVRWFRKAADVGLASAQGDLAWMYEHGLGVSQDNVEAVKWYRKAADQDSAYAQANLGWMYRDGQGVTKDYTEAMKWLRKAADKGNTRAEFGLGTLYKHGWGVAADTTEAAKWYTKAANKNHPRAQNSLGYAYENGIGVERDVSLAADWYRRAADHGDAYGHYNLGRMYEAGMGGLQRDLTEAIRCYRRAAELGHDGAKKSLHRLTSA